MKRILRVLGYALAVVLALGGIGVAALYAWTNGELKTTVPLPSHDFEAPTDSASVARGRHVAHALAKCTDCHGEDFSGLTMVDDRAIGRLSSPNLTTGSGGILASYSDADIERAVRHGIARDGRRLLIMPSMDYQYLSDADVGALIAYLRTLQPVDREMPPIKLGPLARALYLAGQMPLFPSEEVTHAENSVAAVPVDSTVEYGRYIGDVGCAGCHGVNYSGGKIAGAPPDWPLAANITPTGIGQYSFEQFDHLLRTGERPDGSKLNPVMPVQATKLMSDVEMVAIYKYLQTIAPAELGVR